jgi:hypothetical protein
VELDAVWPSVDDAVETAMGTPYGPGVPAMAVEGQERARSLFAERLSAAPDGTTTVRTISNVAHAMR